MEQARETNFFHFIPSGYSQGKAILATCCISYLDSRYLKKLQEFLEGCRVCQHFFLQRVTETPKLWFKDWVKSRTLSSVPLFAIWG